MAEQIRLITIKKGHDPRQFTLMAFGGAGPLHAGALASMLGMKGCLIPQTPGVLSAFGLLSANIQVATALLHNRSQQSRQNRQSHMGTARTAKKPPGPLEVFPTLSTRTPNPTI